MSLRVPSKTQPGFKPRPKKTVPSSSVPTASTSTPALTSSTQNTDVTTQPITAPAAPPTPPPTLPPTLEPSQPPDVQYNAPPNKTPRAAAVQLPPASNAPGLPPSLSSDPAPLAYSFLPPSLGRFTPPPTQTHPDPPVVATAAPSRFVQPAPHILQPSVAPSVTTSARSGLNRSGPSALLMAAASNPSASDARPSPGRIPSRVERALARDTPAQTPPPTQPITPSLSHGMTPPPVPSRGATPVPRRKPSTKPPPPTSRRSATPQIDPVLLGPPSRPASIRPSASPAASSSAPSPVDSATLNAAAQALIASIPGYIPPPPPKPPRKKPVRGAMPSRATIAKQRRAKRAEFEEAGLPIPQEWAKGTAVKTRERLRGERYMEIRGRSENRDLSDSECEEMARRVEVIYGSKGVAGTERDKRVRNRGGEGTETDEENEEDEEEGSGEGSSSARGGKRKLKKPKRERKPGFPNIDMEGFAPDEMVGVEVDEGLVTLGDLITTSAAEGIVSARGIELARHLKTLKEAKQREKNDWQEILFRRKQVLRRKGRKEQNAEKAARRELARQSGGDPEEVSADEMDSGEEYDMPPERLTPPSSPRSGRGSLQGTPMSYGGDDEEGEEGDGEEDGGGEERMDGDDNGRHRSDSEGGDENSEGEGLEIAPMEYGASDEDEDEEEDDDHVGAWRYNRQNKRDHVNMDVDDENSGQIIEEEGEEFRMTNATSFAKKGNQNKGPDRWTHEETEFFYYVLREMGANIEFAAAYFPGRTRRQLKRKFRIEDKKDPIRVDWCIANQKMVDQDYLTKTTGYNPEGDWNDVDKLFAMAERDQERANRGEFGYVPDELEGEGGQLEFMDEDYEGEKENEKGDGGDDVLYP